MLFGKKISDEFDILFEEYQKLNKPRNEIISFEEALNTMLPERIQYAVVSQIENAKVSKNYDELEELLRKTFTGKNKEYQLPESVGNYIDNLKTIDIIQKSIDGKVLRLTLEMRKYTQSSILVV